METITVKLSNPIKFEYGNPLNLSSTEEREVETTGLIMDLVRRGALTPVYKTTVTAQKPTPQPKKATSQHTTITKPNQTTKHTIKINVAGIGSKTLKDINDIYNNEEQLKAALIKDKSGLRDDIADKLKKFYKLIKK